MTATAEKGYKGLGMEGSIARWYEKNTRKSMEEFRREAERLKAFVPDGGDVLEVAPGPGFLAIEMARDSRMRVTGLDISRTFVELARKNAAEAGVPVQFQQGNASEMPFADRSFDLLICRAAFKNFSEPEKALKEMRRVLRPGGTGVIIDLRRDATMTDIKRAVDGMGLNAWNRWLTTGAFRFMLLRRAYTKPELEKMLDRAGHKTVEVRTNDIGMEAWF
ncbi:MAG TPA: methyltransferase domain-containing protein [Bryobacteraceae bacterium]|jgi:ubiquinone/menaquinone biosynthesis C-methylase UbiE|nr:methyltransferase domain-containing protein [Bryobacteraceae bacterium]